MKYRIICHNDGGNPYDTGYLRTFEKDSVGEAREERQRVIRRLKKRLEFLKPEEVKLFRVRVVKKVVFKEIVTPVST